MSGFISKGRLRFIRHRDITNSEKEIKKEKAVLQKTLEGYLTLILLTSIMKTIHFAQVFARSVKRNCCGDFNTINTNQLQKSLHVRAANRSVLPRLTERFVTHVQ